MNFNNTKTSCSVNFVFSVDSYFAGSGGVGRVMSGGGVATGNPYHYPYYHPSAYTG